MSELQVTSHVNEVQDELKRRISVISEAVGLQAEGYAIKEITDMGAVDTGRLRNSITFVTENAQGSPNTQSGAKAKTEDYAPHGVPAMGEVYIGTNVEYAQYIELGARGRAPRPFLKNAILKSEYKEKYSQIYTEGLKG